MAKEALARRYLLGTLPEDERQRVEDLYFSKPERFEELVAAENDLIDSYVRRALSSSEARLFESNYLSSPERWAGWSLRGPLSAPLPSLRHSTPSANP